MKTLYRSTVSTSTAATSDKQLHDELCVRGGGGCGSASGRLSGAHMIWPHVTADASEVDRPAPGLCVGVAASALLRAAALEPGVPLPHAFV